MFPDGSSTMFIHPVRSLISNIYLVESDAGVIIVDTGFADAAGSVLQTLDQLGHTPHDVRLIFLTHVHMDHAGSAAELRRRTGAPIAMHRADLQKARAGKHNMPTGRGLTGKLIEYGFNGAHLKFLYEPFEPDILLDEGPLPPEFGLNARVIYTPGHTLGSVSLALGDGVMLIGDAMINQIRVGMPLYGEDIESAYDSVRKLNALRPRVLYSGHGAPFSGQDLARYFVVKQLEAERANA
jgi:glyoxylase-like metal-dependent hydrolase (beta-lactamase superfamily II)